MSRSRMLKKEQPIEKTIGRQDFISFGFAFLHDISYTDCNDADFFIKFLQRLKKLCNVEWSVISTTQRHSFGYEKIPIHSIKKDINITKDIKFLFAFRASGDNRAFLGFRDGNVFQIVFIEYKFGDIYNH